MCNKFFNDHYEDLSYVENLYAESKRSEVLMAMALLEMQELEERSDADFLKRLELDRTVNF